MVNSEAFVGRLEKILDYYNLTASAFAEKIGVQRSSISHLLSGRNKPSLEFVLKVIGTFPEVNLYWLLNGKGSFPSPRPADKDQKTNNGPNVVMESLNPGKDIDKIIIFYKDGSFESYQQRANDK